MGIHNEPGVRRDKIPALPTVVSNLLSFLKPSISDKELPVAVMINNLGGLSVLELNVIAEEVAKQLFQVGLDIRRILVGTFVTSLDGPGFSITVLKLRPGFENLLNARTTAPAWPNLVEPIGNVNGIVERTVAKADDPPRGDAEMLLPGMYRPDDSLLNFGEGLAVLRPHSISVRENAAESPSLI